MRVTRRQLRKLINKAILNEAEFKTMGAGKYGTMASAGLGAAAGFGAGPIGGAIGLGLGAAAGKSIANKFGYQSGNIPVGHPLHPESLYLEYGVLFNNSDELLNYLESIEGGKFKAMYHIEDFESLGEVASATLKLLGEIDRVFEGLEAALSTANSMKSAGVTGGYGLGDEKVRNRLGRAKNYVFSLFDDDSDIA